MIQIDLDQHEIETLVDVLENYLSELRMEISDTDSYDFRQMLKGRKAVVQKVLDELRHSPPASSNKG